MHWDSARAAISCNDLFRVSACSAEQESPEKITTPSAPSNPHSAFTESVPLASPLAGVPLTALYQHYRTPPSAENCNITDMHSAFVSALPNQFAAPAQHVWRCSLEDKLADSSLGKDRLSSVDKQYLSKIRARLLNPRRMVEAAGRRDASASDTAEDAILPVDVTDDIDDMEDIIFDRSPQNERQTLLYGGWLDDAVAGRKATKNLIPSKSAASGGEDSDASVESHRPVSLSQEEAIQTASEMFTRGMVLFTRGLYKPASQSFAEAVRLVGLGSRLGGQYQLWYAQALDASGVKGKAASMLDQLQSHADPDVRKVSRELYFIMTAPALELDRGSFIDIPSFDDDRATRMTNVLTSSFGPLSTAFVEKKPDRYSLEWYMEKERPPKVDDNTGTQALLLFGAILCALAFMFHTPS